MAKKNCGRVEKDTGNHGRKQEVPSDEITLRDEILDLKRQVMILKRTNEQYSVRLRKYEDESKRKDRQLEQLMNPRKNADITKVLSTKGAAILMNLKDQNNALIQMLLNKDLHIRRLAAEVKMSKLYASTKRNECYKAEINRLRNLLMKSEEMLRENVEVQQEQTRSICAGENPISESSSSSDQSSSSDLDELRYTILSLESHIKYSNDLLAQKNKEISLLSDEVSFLRRYIRYRGSKSEKFEFDSSRPQKISTTFTHSWPDPLKSKKLSTQDLLNFFERNPTNEFGPFPHSTPAASTMLTPSCSSTLEQALPVAATEDRNENRTTTAMMMRTDLEYSTVSTVGKSLFHNLAAEEVLKAEKTLSRSRKPLHTKGKWKQALNKYKELKKLNPRLITGVEQHRQPFAENVKFSGLETQDFEVTEHDFGYGRGRSSPINDEITFRAVGRVKSEESHEQAERLEPVIKQYTFSAFNDVDDNDVTLESCQTFENSSASKISKKCPKAESSPTNHSEYAEADLTEGLNSPSSAQREPKTSFRNNSEELKLQERKFPPEGYPQSLDSSFDSENNYSTQQEFHQVQVEVQINTITLQNCSVQLENVISENRKTHELKLSEETDGHRAGDFEFNDDDDVIIR